MIYPTFVLELHRGDLPSMIRYITAHKITQLEAAVIVISTFVKRSFIKGYS